jgi:hypothetical protein
MSPQQKIGLALNYIAKSDVPVGLVLANNLRVLPTEQVRRIVLAGNLLAYNPAFVNCVSLNGCRVLLLHEFARILTPRPGKGTDPLLYEIACDLWINTTFRPFYWRIIFDGTAFREEFIEGALRAIGLFVGEPPCESLSQTASLEEVFAWVVSNKDALPPGLLEPAFESEIHYADPGTFVEGKVHDLSYVLRELAGEPVSPPPENPEILKSNFAKARLYNCERGLLQWSVETCPQKFFKSLGLPELLEKFPSEE